MNVGLFQIYSCMWLCVSQCLCVFVMIYAFFNSYGLIFWSDINSNVIMRAKFDGTDKRIVADLGIKRPGMALYDYYGWLVIII